MPARALGADAVAAALPFLKAASDGESALDALLAEFIHTLKREVFEPQLVRLTTPIDGATDLPGRTSKVGKGPVRT